MVLIDLIINFFLLIIEKFCKRPKVLFKKETPAVGAGATLYHEVDEVVLDIKLYNKGEEVALDIKGSLVDAKGQSFFNFNLERVDPREKMRNKYGYIEPKAQKLKWDVLESANTPLFFIITYKDDYGRLFQSKKEIIINKSSHTLSLDKDSWRVTMERSPLKGCFMKEKMSPPEGFVS